MSREGHISRLNKASGVFSFVGAGVYKLQSVPILFLPAICCTLASLSYLISFILWITANSLSPKNERKKNAWYGFAQFKNQYTLSALIGTCAIACSLIGIFFPVSLVIAGWLYVLSQFIWIIAEYHKYKCPPQNDRHYSESMQRNYLRMTVFLTGIGIITACATTAAFLFPPFSIPIFLIATIVSLILNLGAVEAWLSYKFDPHTPDFDVVTEISPDLDTKEEARSVLQQEIRNEATLTWGYPFFSHLSSGDGDMKFTQEGSSLTSPNQLH